MYRFAHLGREPAKIGMDPGSQIDLFHRAIAQLVELHAKAITVFWRALDQGAPLQDHKRTVRGAFVQTQALAKIRQT
jgi:hypothetical protein